MARIRLEEDTKPVLQLVYPKALPVEVLDEVLAMLGEEKWFDQAAAFGKAVWTMHGVCSRYVFGDPLLGKRPSIEELTALGPKLKLLDQRLKAALVTLKAPATITGANINLLDLNEIIVLVECTIRLLKLLLAIMTPVPPQPEKPNPLAPPPLRTPVDVQASMTPDSVA